MKREWNLIAHEKGKSEPRLAFPKIPTLSTTSLGDSSPFHSIITPENSARRKCRAETSIFGASWDFFTISNVQSSSGMMTESSWSSTKSCFYRWEDMVKCEREVFSLRTSLVTAEAAGLLVAEENAKEMLDSADLL